ncbi:MAG TPA: TIGR03364 family FAD-dependent oxidoreductase [Acidimicrobiales bacterium]|nr:TIGR03364 family FAD-dependent oxidoreductase [Acidimicrobiales bacterium]
MERAIVVGGGVLGTMHALALRRAGWEVIQLEADAAPRSASLRNFGLIWVGGRRAGAELAAALRARELWEALAGDVPAIGFRPEGSLTVALEPAALRVMEEFMGFPDAAGRGIELLGPAEVRRVNPAVCGPVLGALWCQRDAVVEPRAVLGAVRDHLTARGGYTFQPDTTVVEVAGATVSDHRGTTWPADLVIVATGAVHHGVRGVDLTAAPLRRVRLQMLQTEPYPERLPTSLADADSLRYYPAYAAASLDTLPPQSPMAARQHLQLLVAQRADGGLTIGDTHLYDEPFDFDLDEAPSAELLGRASRILGRDLPPVARRWDGVYSQCTEPDALCYRNQPQPGVWVVTGPGGRGMTCAPVIAEDTLTAAGVLPA